MVQNIAFMVRKCSVLGVGLVFLCSAGLGVVWANDVPDSDSAPESVYEVDVPGYKLHRPQWAVEIEGSIEAFGLEALRGASFRFEYQPSFLQSLGVFGVGPSVNFYPEAGASNWMFSVGGQVRYQARFFREQFIVPFVGYAAEYLSYRYHSSARTRFMITGPVFGGMLLLNVFEPDSAASFYSNTGVSRSYLVAELRNLTGSGDQTTLNERSLFFGLRIEF